jgi:glycosyltransferase involved in cell wall biosynthesis
MLPFFLQHYGKFAERIVIYDNLSNDRTPAIIREHPKAELRTFDTNGIFCEDTLLEIRNNAYKESIGSADFVVVVDVDEFLFHPRLIEKLATCMQQGVTFPKIQGFDMISFSRPKPNHPLPLQIQLGRPAQEYSKRIVFSPEIDIRYTIGCHTCSPIGHLIEDDSPELILLHYHYVGFFRCLKRHHACLKRMPWKKGNRNYQFRMHPLRLLTRFFAYSSKAVNVFNGKPTILNMARSAMLGK